MTGVGVVAIGRNEGERLGCCLGSLAGLGLTVVYVDSGSADGSVAVARGAGVDVVELGPSRPFTAARARNAGFERLLKVAPGVRFVQFLDGDCELADGWPDRARGELETRPTAAVVFGRRRERFPERSVYNRMADVEWDTPIRSDGEAVSCGGDAMVRAEAFRAVGGYDPTVPAGEEPELCRRLRRAGWSVVRLADDMTWHDSALLRFRPWARRQFRSGYGGLDVSTRFGGGGDDPFRRQVVSARVWALGWPLAVAAGGVMAGWPVAGVIALAPVAQAVRIALRERRRAGGGGVALAYGILTVVGKGFQAAGQAAYLRDRLAGRHARLIEYKGPTPILTESGMVDGTLADEGFQMTDGR